MTQPLRRQTPCRGQNAVEFALVLPVLVLVAIGVLDLGRLFFAAITITNAARVGARYASLHPDDPAAIIDATQAETAGSGIDLTDTTISSIGVDCPEGCGQSRPIRVTVTYRFALITGVIGASDIEFSRFAEFLVQ